MTADPDEPPDDLNWHCALYATNPKTSQINRHRVALYIAVDRDWPSHTMARNGHGGPPLAVAKATAECGELRAAAWRAKSWRYSGRGRETLAGLANDLRTLGFDEATVNTFVEAARPHLPESLAALPELPENPTESPI